MGQSAELEQYLNKVCGEVKAREMHRDIRRELGSHLEELILEKEGTGLSGEQAVADAISQMGDPQALGKDLHKIHKPRTPWSLIAAVLLFSVISLLGMGSLEAAAGTPASYIDFFKYQIIYILTGSVLMCGMYFINFRKLQHMSWWLYGGALAGIAASLRYGVTDGGTRHYLMLWSFAVDIISYSPYILIVALAGIYSMDKSAGVLGKRANGWREMLILLVPVYALWSAGVLPELITYLVCELILYTWISGTWLRSLAVGAVSTAAGAAYAWHNQQIRERITGAFNYNLHPDASGYTYRILNETLASAGWRGHGYGAKLEALGHTYSDMLPAYLIYCFGWGGGLLLLAVALWFFIKLNAAFRAVKEPYGRAVILALSLMLVLRILYGLSVLSGKMVLTALPFPFLNYGGHVLMEYAALGLLMGIYRRKDIIPLHEH